MLTAKQEHFAQCIVDGCTQLEAYKRAYNAENMADQSISSNAYKLINDTKIALRIEELRELLALKCMFPLSERLSILKSVATSDDSKGSEKVSAVKAVTEILGDGAASKKDVRVTSETEVTKEQLSTITDEELERIIASGGI